MQKLSKQEKTFLSSVKHGGAHSFYAKIVELGGEINELSKDVVKVSVQNKSIYMRRNTVPLLKRQGQMARDKCKTKVVLRDAGLSVAKEWKAEKISDVVNLKGLKFPLVVKPQKGTRAKGLTRNVKTNKELREAVRFALSRHQGPALIEEMFFGEEYRLLVFKGKVLSVVQKVRPTIVGDGKKTAKELIETYNKKRKNEQQLKIDKEVREALAERKLKLTSVLPLGEKLVLKQTCLMAEGARLVNETEATNSLYKKAAISATLALNLQFGGVDIMAEDIEKPGDYIILEVNSSPYYNMHEKELIEGKAVDVSEILVKDIFKI
jgi:cyanophycin synthetase